MAKKFPASSSGGDPVGSYVEVSHIAPVDDKYLDITSEQIIAKADHPAWSGVNDVIPNKPALSGADSEFTPHWSSMQYANGYDFSNGKFFKVAVPFQQVSNADTHMQVYESTDLVSWAARGTNIPDNIDVATNLTDSTNRCAWDGTSTYVVSLDNGRVATSTDSGATWTEYTPLSSNGVTCRTLEYVNGYFYITYNNRTGLYYSADGITWAAVNGFTTDNYNGLIVPITGGAFFIKLDGSYGYWTDPSVTATTGTLPSSAASYDFTYQPQIWADGAGEIVVVASTANSTSHVSRSTDGGATWNSYTVDGSSRAFGAVFKAGSTYYMFDSYDDAPANRSVWTTTDFSSFVEVTNTEQASFFTNTSIQSTLVTWQHAENLRRVYQLGGTTYFQYSYQVITTTDMSNATFVGVRQANAGPIVVGTLSDNTIDGYYYYSHYDTWAMHLIRSRGVPSIHGGEYVATIDRNTSTGTHIKHSNGLWIHWSPSVSQTTAFECSFDLVNWYSPTTFNYIALNSGTDLRDVFYDKTRIWGTANGTRMWRTSSDVTADTIAGSWQFEERTYAAYDYQSYRFWDFLGDGSAILTGSYPTTSQIRFEWVKNGTKYSKLIGVTSGSSSNCYSVIDFGDPDYVYLTSNLNNSTYNYLRISKDGNYTTNQFQHNGQAPFNNASTYYYLGMQSSVFVDNNGDTYAIYPEATLTQYNADEVNVVKINPIGLGVEPEPGSAYTNLSQIYTETNDLSIFYGPADSGAYVRYDAPEGSLYHNGVYYSFYLRDVMAFKFYDYDPETNVLIRARATSEDFTKYLVKVKE